MIFAARNRANASKVNFGVFMTETSIYPKKRRGCTMHRLAATTSLLISLTPALAARCAARAAPFPS